MKSPTLMALVVLRPKPSPGPDSGRGLRFVREVLWCVACGVVCRVATSGRTLLIRRAARVVRHRSATTRLSTSHGFTGTTQKRSDADARLGLAAFIALTAATAVATYQRAAVLALIAAGLALTLIPTAFQLTP